MIDEREKALNNISKSLAIIRYDIEHRQSISNYSLNIHAENYFRDVFNFVYDLELENANFKTNNVSCIDLIDRNQKIAYQITTTRTKEKLINTLKALKKPEYDGYIIKIFYLLEKSKPNTKTIEEIKQLYDIDLRDCLSCHTDLIGHINNLQHTRLLELNSQYFTDIAERYTNERILDLVFKHLVANYKNIKQDYNDSFGLIDTTCKLELNNINKRITSCINNGLDHIKTLQDIQDDNTLSELKTLVVDVKYKNILLNLLESQISRSMLSNKTIYKLHELSREHDLDFNKIIDKLHTELENEIDIKDFNSNNISWIIVAFFFEICEVGVK